MVFVALARGSNGVFRVPCACPSFGGEKNYFGVVCVFMARADTLTFTYLFKSADQNTRIGLPVVLRAVYGRRLAVDRQVLGPHSWLESSIGSCTQTEYHSQRVKVEFESRDDK